MRKLLSIFILCFTFLSCSNNDEDCCSGIPGDDDKFTFSILNEQGEDLLDPSVEGSLNTSAIKLFRLENGERKEIYNIGMDHPEGYLIYEQEGFFRIFPMLAAGDALKTKGFIQWSTHDEDTLELEHIEDSGIKFLVKVSFNGEVVWDRETDTDGDRFFQIVK